MGRSSLDCSSFDFLRSARGCTTRPCCMRAMASLHTHSHNLHRQGWLLLMMFASASMPRSANSPVGHCCRQLLSMQL